MRLVWFILHGYKRFEARTDVHLDGRLIAISGPNEAGKSTLLDALAHLSHDQPIFARELTRRTPVPDDQVILRARFLLDAGDIASVSDLHAGAAARWLIVEKVQDGSLRTGVEPRLTRDLKPRQRAASALTKLEPAVARLEAKAAAEAEEEVDEDGLLAAADVRSLADALRVDDENLSAGTQRGLADVATKLAAAAGDLGTAGERAREVVQRAVEYEEEHPHGIARHRLARRRPRFLPFREVERTLQSEYDLLNDVPSLPETAALRNLAALADFDLATVSAAVQSEDIGLVETLTRQANERLADRSRVSWRQSEITVRFRIDDATLALADGVAA